MCVCLHVWPHVHISTNSAHSRGSRLLGSDFENTSHPSLCVFPLRNVSTPFVLWLLITRQGGKKEKI